MSENGGLYHGRVRVPCVLLYAECALAIRTGHSVGSSSRCHTRRSLCRAYRPGADFCRRKGIVYREQGLLAGRRASVRSPMSRRWRRRLAAPSRSPISPRTQSWWGYASTPCPCAYACALRSAPAIESAMPPASSWTCRGLGARRAGQLAGCRGRGARVRPGRADRPRGGDRSARRRLRARRRAQRRLRAGQD